MASLDNSASLSILAYCFSSISMTVVNKYVVSGSGWNLFFFYLAIQVCTPILFSSIASRARLSTARRQSSALQSLQYANSYDS